jgi:broad specificity phosphatase PhoE
MIYLVRHGSTGRDPGVLPYDNETLDPVGVLQAIAIGDFLADELLEKRPVEFYCSKTIRCRETATLIDRSLMNRKIFSIVETDNAINEYDYGPYTGKHESIYHAKLELIHKYFDENEVPIGVEGILSFRSRVACFIGDIVRRIGNTCNSAIVVTSSEVIKETCGVLNVPLGSVFVIGKRVPVFIPE